MISLKVTKKAMTQIFVVIATLTMFSMTALNTFAQNLEFPEISLEMLNAKSNFTLNQGNSFQMKQSLEFFDLDSPRDVIAADLDVLIATIREGMIAWYENTDGIGSFISKHGTSNKLMRYTSRA